MCCGFWPTAYVGDVGPFGLAVVNVGNPALPTIRGRGQGNAYGVAVSGSLVYTAERLIGPRTTNVADPGNPTTSDILDTPGTAEDVVVSGTTAYVADDGSGLLVVDVSTPNEATILGSWQTPNAVGVELSGNLAYVTAGVGGGLSVIDISEPTTPEFLGAIDTLGQSFGVSVSGFFAYVNVGTSGIQVVVVDVSCCCILCTDCNGNNIPDNCDIAMGMSEDCDGNAIPDECPGEDLFSPFGPVILSGHDADDHGGGTEPHCQGETACGGLYPAFITMALEHSDSPGSGLAVVGAQGVALEAVLSWVSDPAIIHELPDAADILVADFSEFSVIYVPSWTGHTPGGIDQEEQDALYARRADLDHFVRVIGGGLIVLTQDGSGHGFDWVPFTVDAAPACSGLFCPTVHLLLNMPNFPCLDDSDTGPRHNSFVGPPGFSGLLPLMVCEDPSSYSILGNVPVAPPDCNDNGVPDECDIVNGTSEDCNENGAPDECDIANGTSEDCNNNGVIDECDLNSGTPDCNGNEVPDECDIASGVSEDTNGNGIPDECEECQADVTGDGTVGFADVLAILGAWGPCMGCPEDVNGDGAVGFADMLAVLAQWGPCSPGPMPPTVDDIFNDLGLDYPSDWNLLIAGMEDPNATQLDYDNWTCWMDHYYYAHFLQTCLCAPTCAGTDPWGNH